MIVALIALLIALSGTAVAASGVINGSKIKNGTIAGQKLKKHTLTGTQINLAKLGTVPSAAAADHAASAGTATTAASAANASKLGGLAPGAFVQGGGQVYTNAASEAFATADATVMTIPGVGELKMGCGSAGDTDFSLGNATGVAVELTDTGNYFLVGTGAQTESGGQIVSAGGTLISDLSLRSGQFHLTLVWPQASPAHGADLTIGWYKDSTLNKCALTVSGFVH
jgi:hypothetical protein